MWLDNDDPNATTNCLPIFTRTRGQSAYKLVTAYERAHNRDDLMTRDWFSWRAQGFKPADIVLGYIARDKRKGI